MGSTSVCLPVCLPGAAALAALSLVLGCGNGAPATDNGPKLGGSAGAPGAAGGSSSGGSVSTIASKGSSSVTGDATHVEATISMNAVEPGGEDHVCVVVQLPNPDIEWVTDVHATLSTGSHHLIVDRSAPGTTLNDVPVSCFPTEASDATRLMIAQQKDTHVTLPDGVAFSLVAQQPLFLQLHYINLSSDVENIEGTVDLTFAPSGAPTPIEAHSIFTGSMSIDLPPHSPGTSTSFFVPQPSTGTDHVFALTSHTHSLGVDSTIERVASADAPATTPIHESKNWAEPPLTQFSQPLLFTGQDGLRLTCNYMNTTNQTVTFGTAFHDEMCFMWVYYYDQ